MVGDDRDAVFHVDPECRCDWYHSPKCPAARALRNSWCTPKWLAEIVGRVDLDPCSNSRSHVDATLRRSEEYGGNGLLVDWRNAGIWSVFVNPPYGNGEVIKWVRHYLEAGFIFLLRWDPSTRWYATLWPHCWGAWFPNRRINFEPPPRIRSSSNPFPHALYLHDEPTGEFLDRLLANGYLLRNTAPHDSIEQGAGDRGTNCGVEDGAGGEGSGAGETTGQRPGTPSGTSTRDRQDWLGWNPRLRTGVHQSPQDPRSPWADGIRGAVHDHPENRGSNEVRREVGPEQGT